MEKDEMLGKREKDKRNLNRGEREREREKMKRNGRNGETKRERRQSRQKRRETSGGEVKELTQSATGRELTLFSSLSKNTSSPFP